MKRGFALFVVCFLAVFAVGVGQAMAVNVYAEGAYTESDLVVYIYADVDVVGGETPLRSAGVKLTYNTAELTNPIAEKNESVWYLGNESYMDPEVDPVNGEVIFVLGKLDETYPDDGVPAPEEDGSRILLGKVAFSRTDSNMPFSPTLMTLDYGKRGNWDDVEQEYTFKNFVDTAQVSLDDVSVNFGAMGIYERGDANEDGYVDSRDIRILRKKIGTSDLPCWFDCSGDGTVDSRDIRCLRRK